VIIEKHFRLKNSQRYTIELGLNNDQYYLSVTDVHGYVAGVAQVVGGAIVVAGIGEFAPPIGGALISSGVSGLMYTMGVVGAASERQTQKVLEDNTDHIIIELDEESSSSSRYEEESSSASYLLEDEISASSQSYSEKIVQEGTSLAVSDQKIVDLTLKSKKSNAKDLERRVSY